MPQEQTAKTISTDQVLTGGRVRPKSKKSIVWLNSVYHTTPFAIEEVHSSLADKMVAEGKARFGNKLTDQEKADNKAYLAEKIKSKGRTPGKVEKEEELEDLDDLMGAGKKANSVKK